MGGNFQRHVHKCLWKTDVKCPHLQKSWWNAGRERRDRPRWSLTGTQWLQQSCEYSKTICKGWVSELQCWTTLHEYWTLTAWGNVQIVKGFSFLTGPAVWGWVCVVWVEQTAWKRVPWERNSRTRMLCTLACSFTSPLRSQRLSLALCRQKLKFTEKIVTQEQRQSAPRSLCLHRFGWATQRLHCVTCPLAVTMRQRVRKWFAQFGVNAGWKSEG